MNESNIFPSWVVAMMEETALPAIEPPVLDPRVDAKKYKLDFDFRNAENWKAKIYLANSCNKDQRKGMWDGSRYVMISLTGNTIIPIAMADEHHVGYDLLHSLKIPTKEFYSFDSWGTNYIYYEEDAKELYIAGQKFIQWGGDPYKSLVVYANGDITTNLAYFLKSKGNLKKLTALCTVKTGKLMPTGDMLIKEWRELAKLAHLDPMAKSSLGLFYRKTKDVIKSTYEKTERKLLYPAVYVACNQTLDLLYDEGDYSAMVNFVFGYIDDKGSHHKHFQSVVAETNPHLKDQLPLFRGVHNFIHNQIRELKNRYDVQRASSLFGDLDHFEKLWGSM